jgi:hypothetical protein
MYSVHDERRNTNKTVVEKLKGRNSLGNLSVEVSIMVK